MEPLASAQTLQVLPQTYPQSDSWEWGAIVIIQVRKPRLREVTSERTPPTRRSNRHTHVSFHCTSRPDLALGLENTAVILL